MTIISSSISRACLCRRSSACYCHPLTLFLHMSVQSQLVASLHQLSVCPSVLPLPLFVFFSFFFFLLLSSPVMLEYHKCKISFHLVKIHSHWTSSTSFKGNIGLYVHRNHWGLLGTGKLGVRYFKSNTYSLHCHHLNDSALRWAVVWAILMFH